MNNTGDTIRVHYVDIDGTDIVFDEVTYTADEVSQGVATELSADKLSASSNDAMENWCPSTIQITGHSDFGTPGVLNQQCSSVSK